ncbi:MAG: class B sortase [Sarcina sp.]
MNKGIKIIINSLLVGTFCFSIYKICYKLYDYKKAEMAYTEIEKIFDSKNISNLDSYLKLKDINNDYRFWIQIENTNVDYPVVQTIDNSFYLKKDFYKKDSSSGTIFLDHRNDYKENFNNLIYGHNMKNQTIFNNVENYKNANFFTQKNKIIIKDDKHKYTYEPFSVYIADGSIDASNHTDVNSSSDQEIEKYITSIKNKSLHSSNLEVAPKDKIISLITCSYESSDVRTIVHAKLINTEII